MEKGSHCVYVKNIGTQLNLKKNIETTLLIHQFNERNHIDSN